MELIFFNQSTIVRHLDWFQFFFLINHAVMNIHKAKSFHILVSLVLNPRSWIAWSKTAIILMGIYLICPLGWHRTSGWQKSAAHVSQTKSEIGKEGEGISVLFSWGSFVCILPCYKFEEIDGDPHIFWLFQALNIRLNMLKIGPKNHQEWTLFITILLPWHSEEERQGRTLSSSLCWIEMHVCDTLRRVTVKCRLIVFHWRIENT